MDRKHLLSLPEELKTAIFNYISLPGDLYNLRLTCKEIEPFAVARSYHEVTVNLSNWTYADLLYRNGYCAHRYIRYLVFKVDRLEYSDRRNVARVENLRNGMIQLLRLLPHSRLKGIETPMLLPLGDTVVTLLAVTQRNLVNASLGPLHGSHLGLDASLKPWPINLHFLEIKGYFGDGRDFTSYREIMTNSRNLKQLVLRYLGTEPIVPSFDDKAHDDETSDGLVSKSRCKI